MNALSSRLAAHGGIRQVEVSLKADRAANAADGAVLRVWREIVRLIERKGLHAWNAWEEAVQVCGRLLPAVRAEMAGQMRRVATWTHQETARTLKRVLPVGVMNAARVGGYRQPLQGHRRRISDTVRRRITEDFKWEDLLSPLRGGHSDRDYFASILFPAPTEAELNHVVYSSGWEQRFMAGTHLAQPQALASVIVSGMAAGKNHREIARDLLPAVQGVQSSAKRIARTECLRVAGAAQMDCHSQLGDLVAGYQIHALLDQHTRPAHAARSGTIYWAKPKPGQLGYDVMPRPPQEANGSTAWNCRCFMTVVLHDPGTIMGKPLEPVFTDNEASLIPDHVVFSDWFRAADEKRRRTAVGTRRYSLLRDKLGREPNWEHFLDDDAANLMSLADLKAETEQERHTRLAKVYAAITRRHIAKRLVATYGFIPGE